MSERSAVLRDHSRRKKVLISPMNAALGNLHEVSWRKEMIPEFIWIALLQHSLGEGRGLEAIRAISRHTRQVWPEKKSEFSRVSHFNKIPPAAVKALKKRLEIDGQLGPIQHAFAAFFNYPSCPLTVLLGKPHLDKGVALKTLKDTIATLFDRTSRRAMLVQANVIGLMFDADLLQVGPGMGLGRLSEMQHYPDTVESKMVAASIRSSLNAFFSLESTTDENGWPAYFWNRGLSLEPCG